VQCSGGARISQWEGFVEVWGQSPQLPGAIGGGSRGKAPAAGSKRVVGDFCNFSTKLTYFYAHFC